MIPTMILLGLVLGRWWRTALLVSTVGWPALLLSTGVIDADQIPVAAIFGVANAAVGVAITQAVLALLRARPRMTSRAR